MSARRSFRLPPSGRRLAWSEIAAALAPGSPGEPLRAALGARLGGAEVTLTASGREALRQAFVAAARETGRGEAVVPAYTCFSVAAAAVAAGLRVRLVDVTAEGAIDADALAALPLERAAAVVACNLFGFAEPLEGVAKLAGAAGARVIDDAAQAFGAVDAGRAAGARGEFGVLSFGRGKPLSALGGGALVRRRDAGRAAAANELEVPPAHGARSVLQAVAYNAALSPRVFGWLAAIPALGIGETPFAPDFARGGLGSDRAAVALAVLGRFDAEARARQGVATALAARLGETAALRPIRAERIASGVHPRLACLAPDAGRRAELLRVLDAAGAGASAFYPTPLGDVPGLAPHLEGPRAQPGAASLAERLVTLPTHGGLTPDALAAALRGRGGA